MRRILLGTVATAAAIALLPAPSSADAVVTFESPQPDEDVAEPIPLVVTVERRFVDAHPERVALALSQDGVAAHERSRTVDLDCVENCGEDASVTTSRWAGPDLDPHDLAPFGDVPACNGRWWLLPEVEPGPTFRSGHGQGSFLVSLPPSAVRELAVAVADGGVQLSWRAPPEADVAGYRIERRAQGADQWEVVADLPAAARTHRDEPGQGSFAYRVASLRPDGRIDRQPVAACADDEPDLATASAPWTVRLSGSGGSAVPPDGGTGTEPGPGGTADPDEGEASGGTAAGSPRGRTAASGGSGGPPRPPDLGPPERDERYFGEDGPFSDRIDYGDVEGVAADPETTTERVPGGVVEIFDRELELDRVLRPAASGMVLIAFGLHLRRWLRATR